MGNPSLAMVARPTASSAAKTRVAGQAEGAERSRDALASAAVPALGAAVAAAEEARPCLLLPVAWAVRQAAARECTAVADPCLPRATSAGRLERLGEH